MSEKRKSPQTICDEWSLDQNECARILLELEELELIEFDQDANPSVKHPESFYWKERHEFLQRLQKDVSLAVLDSFESEAHGPDTGSSWTFYWINALPQTIEEMNIELTKVVEKFVLRSKLESKFLSSDEFRRYSAILAVAPIGFVPKP